VILLGEISLRVALLLATWVAVVSYAGGVTRRAELVASGERGVRAILALLVLATASLGTALLAGDFSIRYVASYTSANLPRVYVIAALWAGRPGSLLLSALILAGYSGVAVRGGRYRDHPPQVTGTLAVMMLCLLAALVLVADPFERLEWLPPDGLGMSPLLQSPAVVIHAPITYLGYVATAVPFALAASALVMRGLSVSAITRIYRWSLAAWFFTTVGILIGMRWAYVEPGRGGHWALNPVTNAALLSWLASSALLYSLSVQVKRGVVRAWTVIPVLAVFLLSVFAALVARSGTVAGPHPVVQSPAGLVLTASLIAGILVAGMLVMARLTDVAIPPEMSGSSPSARRRARYGRHVAGVGVALLVAGLVGQAFGREHTVTLRPGEAVTLADPYSRDWRFVGEGISRYDILNRQVTAATVSVYLGDSRAGLLTSEWRQYVDSRGAPTFEPVPEVGRIGTPLQDIHALLGEVAGDDAVQLRLGFTPLVWGVWVGGALLALGGLMALWPGFDGARRPTPEDRFGP
jgi:cytochrome c biogenesis factor